MITNSASGTQRGQKWVPLQASSTSEKLFLDDGSKPEILSRFAQATAAFIKLKPIWRGNTISLGSKVKPMRFISIFMPRHKKWRGIMLYPPNF